MDGEGVDKVFQEGLVSLVNVMIHIGQLITHFIVIWMDVLIMFLYSTTSYKICAYVIATTMTDDIKEKKTADKLKYMREYRENNKEKYAEKRKCVDCGGTYVLANSGHHKHSDKHQRALQHTLLVKNLENRCKALEELCRQNGIQT